MGLVNFLLCSVGKCIEIICFLLDLNFVIVNSLIRLIAALITFVHSIPMLLSNFVVECWNLILLCAITMTDGATVFAHNMVGSWMQLFGCLLESFKMVGYLSSHLLLRTRELLHRGLLSGHGLVRQAWEGCGILLSLLLYFVNTIVNLLLIGTQNLYAVVVCMVEAVSSPLQKVLELTLTVLTFLHSSLVGTSILLWTPCRLTMDFLGSLGHIFISVFLLDTYGLLLTLMVIVIVTIYLNPVLPLRGAQYLINYINTVPTLRSLLRTLQRLSLLELNLRQWLAWPGSRFGLRTAPAWRDATLAGDGHTREAEVDAEQRALHNQRVEREPMGDRNPQPGDDPPGLERASSRTAQPQPQPPPLSPVKVPSGEGHSKGPPAVSLLTLLQEQEERKKCVICQDSTKTVVLLPCRHLCLCRDCTNILLRQPFHQHNCPLCRHMILQTMDVYL